MHACTTLPLISFVASTEYDTHASSSSYDMHASLIASTEAVAERVCGGERLTRPGECPDALWALLQRMWAERPADRPTFVEVAGALVVLRVNQPSEVHGVEQQVFVAAGAREAQVSSFSYDMHASSSSYDMEASDAGILVENTFYKENMIQYDTIYCSPATAVRHGQN